MPCPRDGEFTPDTGHFRGDAAPLIDQYQCAIADRQVRCCMARRWRAMMSPKMAPVAVHRLQEAGLIRGREHHVEISFEPRQHPRDQS